MLVRVIEARAAIDYDERRACPGTKHLEVNGRRLRLEGCSVFVAGKRGQSRQGAEKQEIDCQLGRTLASLIRTYVKKAAIALKLSHHARQNFHALFRCPESMAFIY